MFKLRNMIKLRNKDDIYLIFNSPKFISLTVNSRTAGSRVWHEASFCDRETVKTLRSSYESSPSVFNVWVIKIIRHSSSLLSRFWLFVWKVALKRQTRIDRQSKKLSIYAWINTINAISNTTLCCQTRVKLS